MIIINDKDLLLFGTDKKLFLFYPLFYAILDKPFKNQDNEAFNDLSLFNS